MSLSVVGLWSTQSQYRINQRANHISYNKENISRIVNEDSGCGISDEAIPRIYDAFFTTKETGPQHGLGLGLTSCRAILELHGGLSTLRNREDASGVRATILLPLHQWE